MPASRWRKKPDQPSGSKEIAERPEWTAVDWERLLTAQLQLAKPFSSWSSYTVSGVAARLGIAWTSSKVPVRTSVEIFMETASCHHHIASDLFQPAITEGMSGLRNRKG